MATLIYGFTYGLAYTLVDAAVKASLLLALAAAIAILSRRASASFRHLTWALGLGCILCLPFLSRNLPHWRVSITTPATHSRTAAQEAPPPADAAQPAPLAAASPRTRAGIPSVTALPRPAAERLTVVRPTAQVTASPAPASHVPWAAWVLLVWAGGAVFMLAQLAQSLARVRGIAQTSVPIASHPIASHPVVDAAAKAMSLGRPVALCQASAPSRVSVPITYGALRPVIVLPTQAQEWSDQRLRAVLLHEMAHIRRHDWPLQMMAHIARAFYWFNPLVWLAVHRMRAESEAACDDLVLNVGMPAPEYARHLLDVALSARQSRRIGQGAVAMAQSPKVEGRLRAVLAQGLSRHPVTRRATAGFLAAAVLVALPLAALRLAAHGEAVPVADHLQLQGDFTLRYAVTITDAETPQAQFREYQQLRANYQRELGKDPYRQPVPPEFYAPFSYFQSRRPRTRHLILTVSAQEGKLLWRSEENGQTFALVYNGRDGTQLFSDGHAGRVEPGLQFPEMANCPLPAVGLPHIPLLKGATLINSSGTEQTWQAEAPQEGAEVEQGKALYTSVRVHAVHAEGTWKVLDVDSSDQRFQFLQHQRFQGLWVASHMTLTKYTTANLSTNFPRFSSEEEFIAFIDAHRTPTSVCEYRLLSASTAPLDLSGLGMRTVSAANRSIPNAQDHQLDDLYVQEALHLRYHLQDWAEIHKALLRQMAQAQPNARPAALRVSTSLNGLPFPLWQGDLRPGHVWDGDPRAGHDGQKPLFTAERPSPQDFTTSRDFEIARSRNPGASHVVLWASGRITRSGAQGAKGPERQQEIVPAFFGADGTSSMAANGSAAPSLSSPSPSAGLRLKGEAAAHIARGRQLQQKGQPRDGIPEFRKAVQIDPNNTEAQFQLATALFSIYLEQTGLTKRGTWKSGSPAVLDEAIQHMQTVVAMQPDSAPRQEALGSYLAYRHRWAEAVPHLRRARELLESVSSVRVIRRAAAKGNSSYDRVYDSLYVLCDSFVRSGDYKEAALHYLQALIAAEGDIYASLGRYREAEHLYQQALQFDSFTTYVLFAQGEALMHLGRRAEARTTWKRILSIDLPKTYYYDQVRTKLALKGSFS